MHGRRFGHARGISRAATTWVSAVLLVIAAGATFVSSPFVASAGGATTASPTVSIGDGSIVVKAGNIRSMGFPVTLSQPAAAPMTVQYHLVAATALGGNCTASTAGTDFNILKGTPKTLTFNPGVRGLSLITKYVNVQVCPHLGVTKDLTFQVVLGNPTGGFALGKSTATGTILTDHWTTTSSSAVASVGDKTISDGSTGERALHFELTLSKPATAPIAVQYQVASQTAKCGQMKTGLPVVPGDICYNLNGATAKASFVKNAKSVVVSIPVFGGTPISANETFSVQLLAVTGPGVLGRKAGTGTVVADYTPLVVPPEQSFPPPPGGTDGVGCASVPAVCGFPDDSNTGILPDVTLTQVPGQATSGAGWSYSGGIVRFNVSGATIGSATTGLELADGVTAFVTAPNVTIQNLKVDGAHGADTWAVGVCGTAASGMCPGARPRTISRSATAT